MKYFFFFLFVFIFNFNYGQNSKKHTFVPYFMTLSVKSLSLQLTKNIESDSEKVIAIHSWVTNKIRYDLNKSERFDLSNRPMWRILICRKATCSGYSDLFVKLCEYANIQATVVLGYAKNEFTDVNDKMYMNEHTWVAVNLKNGWILIDPTWDAGYIKYYRITLKSLFRYIFSLGSKSIYGFSPHFKQYPNSVYIFKDPEYFLVNHCPSDSIWQLVCPAIRINDFEKDSQFYYRTFPEKPFVYGNSLHDETREIKAGMFPIDRIISDGFPFFQYNFKNPFPYAISNYIVATQKNEILLQDIDSAIIVKKAKIIDSILQISIIHFDSNLFFLNSQKRELLANNNLKKKIITTQNKNLITSTKTIIRNLKKWRKIGKFGRKNVNSNIVRNNIRLQSRLNSSTIYKIRNPKFPSNKDSLVCVQNIELIKDSIIKLDSLIRYRFGILDSIFIAYHYYFEKYFEISNSNFNFGRDLVYMRRNFEDDLDILVRTRKDSLINIKQKGDSSLFNNNEFILKDFYNNYKLTTKYINQLSQNQKKLSNEYIKLKKLCMKDNDIIIQYQNSLNQYSEQINFYNSGLIKYVQYFSDFGIACKRQKKPSNKELICYYFELEIESYNSQYRSMIIKNRFIALKKLNSLWKKKSIVLKKQTNRIERKYQLR